MPWTIRTSPGRAIAPLVLFLSFAGVSPLGAQSAKGGGKSSNVGRRAMLRRMLRRMPRSRLRNR